MVCVREVGAPASGEADSPHGAHGAVLAPPVREVVVVPLLQDVVGAAVVGLLVHGPPAHRREESLGAKDGTYYP